MKAMITVDELQALKEEGGKLHIIDTLPGEYYEACHVPGARNACVYEMTFLESMAAVVADPAARVVVYGTSGRCRSAAVAVEKLRRAGYHDVRELEGGLEAWKAAGLPVDPAVAAEQGKPLLVDGRYPIDTVASRLEWTGRNLNNRHCGTITISGGEVMVESGRPVDGQVILAMNTIANLDIGNEGYKQMLLAHLSCDDFFDVGRYPTATFRIKGSEALPGAFPGSPSHLVKGTLELKGVVCDQDFPAEIAPQGNGLVKVRAAFDIDRTRWGVLYGSGKFFESLGMHLVSDIITIELFLIALRA